MLLKDKVAIVTGGGRGIGRAISKRFAAEGACVVLAQRDTESGENTQREIQGAGGVALFVRTDVGEASDIQHMVDEAVVRFGTVSVLVNNAAKMGENGHLLEMTLEAWEEVLRIDLTGPFLCAQAAARVMAEHMQGGSIINISSTNGWLPQPRCCAYGAAKGGLEILTKGMAIDLAPYNIRVNTIAPGPILSRSPDGTPPRESAMALLRRTGGPEEVAAVAAFLASDESSYVTGERIAVDGGAFVNAYQVYAMKRPPIGSWA